MTTKVDCQFKILVIGESGVGKTSITRRFECGKFQNRAPTLLADICKKEIVVRGKKVQLRIYDTAGHEEYRERVLDYFKNIDGVLLVYDVTDMMTFSKLSFWLSKVRDLSNGSIALIVGNKIDHPNGKSVSLETVRRYARDEGLEFMETSAKNGDNVDTVFENLTVKVLQSKQLVPPDNSISVSPSGPPSGTDVAVLPVSSHSVPSLTSSNVAYHKSEASSSGVETKKVQGLTKDPGVQPKTSKPANEESKNSVSHRNSPEASAAINSETIAASTSCKKTQLIVEVVVHGQPNPSKENNSSVNEVASTSDLPNHANILPPVVPLSEEDITELYVDRRRKMSSESVSSLAEIDYVVVHRQEVLAEEALNRQEALAQKARSRKNSDCNLL